MPESIAITYKIAGTGDKNMTDAKKTNRSDEIMKKELSPDDLDEASGGRIRIAGYGLLRAIMVRMKALGYDKVFCIQTFKEGRETDCKFRTSFTGQTGDGLADPIGFIDKTRLQIRNDREEHIGFRSLLLVCTTD